MYPNSVSRRESCQCFMRKSTHVPQVVAFPYPTEEIQLLHTVVWQTNLKCLVKPFRPSCIAGVNRSKAKKDCISSSISSAYPNLQYNLASDYLMTLLLLNCPFKLCNNALAKMPKSMSHHDKTFNYGHMMNAWNKDCLKWPSLNQPVTTQLKVPKW